VVPNDRNIAIIGNWSDGELEYLGMKPGLVNGPFERYAVRRRLAGKTRSRAVCGTLPLHPVEIIDLGGDLLFSRQLPTPWSDPGLLTRVRTSSPSTGRAVLERRPAVAVRISPFPALGSTPTVR
jgi:hypothetical protein